MSDILFSDKDFIVDDMDETTSEADTLTVPLDAVGTRLDRYLTDALGITRSTAVRWIETSCVSLSIPGRPASVPDKNTRLKGGEVLTVIRPQVMDYDVRPENIPLDVVYEDADIIVVNKPVGMVVHPAPGNETGTLVHALLYRCGDSLSGIGGVKRPGIVHRIDKDTSGLLVVAKNDDAHLSLASQLKTHSVSRVYHAICVGNLREDSGRIDLAIGRNPTDRKKMAAYPTGTQAPGVREAVTHYTVLERYAIGQKWGQAFTYLRCELETGRTHQIRVHLAAGGHPLLGDPVYGGDGTRFGKACGKLLAGQSLHAAELHLTHPRTGENMTFSCPLPPHFQAVLDKLRHENGG